MVALPPNCMVILKEAFYEKNIFDNSGFQTNTDNTVFKKINLNFEQ